MKNTLIGFLSILALCMFLTNIGYGICYNTSASLNESLFLSIPIRIPVIGDIVAFTHSQSSITFAKRVVGMPGDVVEIKNKSIYINGFDKGKILEPFRAINEGIIPADFYFMLGNHPESFDSRYAEFGLVPIKLIKAKLCPIF